MKKTDQGNNKIITIFTYFCLALAFVSTLSFMVYTILTSGDFVNCMVSIISVIILAVFSILYVIMGLFADNKKSRVFIIIGSCLFSLYSIFQILVGSNIITIGPSDNVPDFYNMDIRDVVRWADERDILINQTFENNDKVLKYHILKQDVKAGTKVHKVKKITVVVSDGPNEEIETDITSVVGWNLDKVIKYIDDNHLTNVNIVFEYNDEIEKDIIFEQDVYNNIKRNDPVTLKSSLGKESEVKSVTMDDLVGLDTFHAIVYLKRNSLPYSIQYAYSEEYDEGIVLKQNVEKWDVINPKTTDKIIITVARKTGITVPNLLEMEPTEITNWATDNRLKLEYEEEYDDTVKEGKVIAVDHVEGATVEVGETIKITLSKGQIRMIKFTDGDSFREWAKEHEVIYNINYQFSDTVASGSLISSSHKENQVIKNTDTVKLTISQGGNTIIPNLIGLTKDKATNSCNKANIICKFVYEDSNSEKDTVIKQSMRSSSNVPISTTVTVTLSK